MPFEYGFHLDSDSCYLCIPSKLRARCSNQRDARGWTPLMHAINTHNERSAMEDMMDGQAPIHARDPSGTDALWLATSNNRAPLVRMLLAAGADATRHGLEKLLEAADAGLARHKQLRAGAKDIKYLPQLCLLDTWHRLTKEALVAWFDQHGHKAREQEAGAATQASASTSSSAASAAASSEPPAGPTATSALRGQLWSALEGRDVGAVTQLLDQGVSPNLTRLDCSGAPSPLIAAAEWGCLPLVRLLLKRGADVHYRDMRGNTALISAGFADASVSDHQQIIRLLIEAGSDVNATNHLDQNALHLAIIARRFGAIRELLSARIDLEVVDLYGETTVSCALFDGPPDFRIIELLIAAGVDPNGRSPIEPHINTILAVCGPDAPYAEPRVPPKAVAGVVQQLVKRRADVTRRTHNGNVALHKAAWCDPAIIRVLLQDPVATAATINAQTYNSRYSPLMEAVAYGQSPRALHVRLLLAAGADTELRNELGETALMLASMRAQTDILKVLLEEGKADPTVKDHSGRGVLDVVGTGATTANLPSVPAVYAMLKAAIEKRQQAQAQAAAGAVRLEAEVVAAQLLAEEEAEKAAAKAAAAKKEKRARKQQQKAQAKEQQEREERERKEQQEREERERREKQEREERERKEQQEREKQQRRQEQEQERQQQKEGRTEKKGEEQRPQRGGKSKPHAQPTPPQHSPSQQQQPAPGSVSSSGNSAPASQQQQPTPFASSSSQPASSSIQADSDGRQARAACTVASSRNVADEELGCVVCMDAARNMVLVPCGHVALCMACCEAVQAARNECPMCRETIVAALELKLA